ncbi:MAG: hypothetical protein SFU87_07775 [Chitinophagaceae bacterium]|nr:hypothetical protein [Chitinophagaceae bacterium]
MRFLKPLMIGITGLAIVILLITSLLPNEVMTSEGIMIHAPKDTVLQAVKQIEGWKDWNLLIGDKTPELSDSGMMWTDVKGGKNQLRVTESNDKGIVAEVMLNDQKPFTSGFSVEQKYADSVQVVWFVIEKLRWYPWEKIYGIMSGGMKTPVMKQSLLQLKSQLQAK